MARIAQFFSYLHDILIAVPQHGYHNISRVVQPQMRSICESFQANTRMGMGLPRSKITSKAASQMQPSPSSQTRMLKNGPKQSSRIQQA